jgi:hypothetical protein
MDRKARYHLRYERSRILMFGHLYMLLDIHTQYAQAFVVILSHSLPLTLFSAWHLLLTRYDSSYS